MFLLSYLVQTFEGMADEWKRKLGLVVGEKDGFNCKEIWVIKSVTCLNDAGYSTFKSLTITLAGAFFSIR